jgi:hypothetical protein
VTNTPDPLLDEWLSLRLDYSAAVSRSGPRSSAGRKASEAIAQFWQKHADRYRELMRPIKASETPPTVQP